MPDIRDIQINLYKQQQQVLLSTLQEMLRHTHEGQSVTEMEWSLRLLRHSLISMIQVIGNGAK